MTLVWDNYIRPPATRRPGHHEAQHTHHRIPALDHTPAISHRRRRRPRVRPGRVWALLRRSALPAPPGMRNIAARRSTIRSRHHVPRRARCAGHAHHPPKQRVHCGRGQVARGSLFHLDPHRARHYRWPRHDTLGTWTVESAFAEDLMLEGVRLNDELRIFYASGAGGSNPT